MHSVVDLFGCTLVTIHDIMPNTYCLTACHRSEPMAASMGAHYPWGETQRALGVARSLPYSAWHIRTSEGETQKSYDPDKNLYIFNDQAPGFVCPLYISTAEKVRAACPNVFAGQSQPMPVFISSNRSEVLRRFPRIVIYVLFSWPRGGTSSSATLQASHVFTQQVTLSFGNIRVHGFVDDMLWRGKQFAVE